MTVTVSDILGEAVEQARPVIIPVALVYSLTVAIGTVADAELAGADMSGLLSFLLSCALLVAQFGLTRAALGAAGYDVGGGFWRFFFLSLIVSIATGLAFLLLVIPGIIVLVRLSAAVPALFAEDLAIGEAMNASWERTREIFWPLLLAFSIVWVPTVLTIAWAFLGSGDGMTNPVSAIIFNLCWNAVLVFGWFLSIAAYRITTTNTVAEVFA